MTASGGHYVQCSTAVRTGGSICANKKNHRRDLIEARVFDGLGALLSTLPMVLLFQKGYGKELPAANKQRAGAHNSLVGELGRVEQDTANLRSEEHTSELQSLMRTSYAVLCLKKRYKLLLRSYF